MLRGKTIRVKKWKVRVCRNHRSHYRDYAVYATHGLDARVLAFALDGGFAEAMTEMWAGSVELALTYTEIVAST